MLLEYCKEGDLLSMLAGGQDEALPCSHRLSDWSFADRLRFAREAAESVAAVHEAGIVHDDLSASNFLVTRTSTGQLTLKVCDFGMAQDSEEVVHREVMGNFEYASHERLAGCLPS